MSGLQPHLRSGCRQTQRGDADNMARVSMSTGGTYLQQPICDLVTAPRSYRLALGCGKEPFRRHVSRLLSEHVSEHFRPNLGWHLAQRRKTHADGDQTPWNAL